MYSPGLGATISTILFPQLPRTKIRPKSSSSPILRNAGSFPLLNLFYFKSSERSLLCVGLQRDYQESLQIHQDTQNLFENQSFSQHNIKDMCRVGRDNRRSGIKFFLWFKNKEAARFLVLI